MENTRPPYPNYDEIAYAPQFAADCLGISQRALRLVEEEPGIEIRRISSGSVARRVYSPADLFQIAAMRRSKGLTRTLKRPMTISTYVQKGGYGQNHQLREFGDLFGVHGAEGPDHR